MCKNVCGYEIECTGIILEPLAVEYILKTKKSIQIKYS